MTVKIKSRTFFWRAVADVVFKDGGHYYPHTYIRDVCNAVKSTDPEKTILFLAAVTTVQERLAKSGIVIKERLGQTFPSGG